jgi:hypothetical protein
MQMLNHFSLKNHLPFVRSVARALFVAQAASALSGFFGRDPSFFPSFFAIQLHLPR